MFVPMDREGQPLGGRCPKLHPSHDGYESISCRPAVSGSLLFGIRHWAIDRLLPRRDYTLPGRYAGSHSNDCRTESDRGFAVGWSTDVSRPGASAVRAPDGAVSAVPRPRSSTIPGSVSACGASVSWSSTAAIPAATTCRGE